jgi:DUF4097 and DUF4098 domain-containing protein YvlB
MRNQILPLALLSCASALAFQPKPSLDCNHSGSSDRHAHFCEMREQTVASTGAISVDASQNGGISIKGWDRSDILVRSQVNAYAATDGEARDLARQINVQSMGQVKAYGPPGDHDRYWSVSYEVFVPTRYSATVETVNGGVNISDVTGNLEFKTVNGGLNLHHVSGNVHGHTTNGGVNIELAGDRWEGQGLEVTTTNGGVNLRVPHNYSAQLEAQTSNGSIRSADLPRDEKQNRVSAPIGNGGAPIKITTTNGGVNVTRI